MEHLVTSANGLPNRNLTDVVVEAPLSAAEPGHRTRRIAELREAIQAGDYAVSSAHLADAMLRAARRAN